MTITALGVAFLLLVLQAGPSPHSTIEFLAVDRDGNAPAELTAADVELKIGGKIRPVVAVERISSAERGRDILLLVDEATLHALEKVAAGSIEQLLSSLAPGDRIRYVSTRGTRANGADAIRKLTWEMVTGPGVLHTCLSDMLRNIENLAKTLPRGRSSTLAVIGRGHPEGASYGSEGDAAPCTPRRGDMRRVHEHVGDAQINVHLFTVSDTSRSWGFETLAGNIGASSRLLTWANVGGLEQAVAETTTVYRATFAADPSAPDRPQRVELKAKRRGVKLSSSTVLNLAPRNP